MYATFYWTALIKRMQHSIAINMSMLPCMTAAASVAFGAPLGHAQPTIFASHFRYVLISVGTMAAYWYSVFSIIYGRAAHGPDYKVRRCHVTERFPGMPRRLRSAFKKAMCGRICCLDSADTSRTRARASG
jgi:hypothetical protein